MHLTYYFVKIDLTVIYNNMHSHESPSCFNMLVSPRFATNLNFQI